ncbi:MAG: trypsin-like peptidase domain-containing protein [Planctomycetaceae bacterium]
MKLLAMLMLATDLNGQPLPDVVLLDFGASYCQPCQQMVPVLQRMENDRFPVRRIDITEQPDISRQYKVDRIPTLIILVEGKEVKRFVGLCAESELRREMHEAARQLEAARKASDPKVASADDLPTVTAPDAPDANAPRPGIRGLFDRMRRGLSGSEKADVNRLSGSEPPDFRAQSPDEQPEPPDPSSPMRASVRVRLMDGKMRDVGTGTIIHSGPGSSIILTCAHIFQKVSDQAAVEVDVFLDGKVLKYPAKVLGGDHESDVSLLRIQNAEPLPTISLATNRTPLDQQEALFSIGCSNGDLPTVLNMNVIEVNRYIGPENILCTNDPSLGRSGGGLFDSENRLVGVCSAADRKAHEGLYTGIKPILKLMTQLKLDSLLNSQPNTLEPTAIVSTMAEESSNPFAESSVDDFDELFDQASPGSEFPKSAGVKTASVLPDPFAAPTCSSMTPATHSPGSTTPTEITVIIDSPDPAKGKQVIVIPHPSPWLMELLTGEKTNGGPNDMATNEEKLK